MDWGKASSPFIWPKEAGDCGGKVLLNGRTTIKESK